MAGPMGPPPRCVSEILMTDRDQSAKERPNADEGFLQRWSRRKAQARSAPQVATEDSGVPAEHRPASLEQITESRQGEPAPVAPEDLPAIDSLDASSDFSVFMRPEVPEHLRTQALRKLWRSDPIYSKLDGLVEYGEDYTISSWPKGVIRTAYQIGRGFVNELGKLGADGDPRSSEEPAPGAAPETGLAVASADPLSPAVPPPEPPASTSGSTTSDPAQPLPPAADTPARRRPRPLPRRG